MSQFANLVNGKEDVVDSGSGSLKSEQGCCRSRMLNSEGFARPLASDEEGGPKGRGVEAVAVSRNPYVYCKFAVDVLVAAILLVLSAPLMVVLAGLVKFTSPGPAFYSQTRLGRGGRPYKIVKIRTMYHNCEATTGAVWSTKGDRRITPMGRFLRDSHLDELPQLINVLKGEMSLIGPRPERPEIIPSLERAVQGYRNRLLVRPGVTGLAQMQLPADSDIDGVRTKLAYDVYYIRNLNVWLDLRIALSTVFYFLGAAAEALCKGMIKPYHRSIERELGQGELATARVEVSVARELRRDDLRSERAEREVAVA